MEMSEKRKAGIRAKGVKVYQYDAITKEYVGMYTSISEAAEDNGLDKDYLAKRLRYKPNGVITHDLLFSRFKSGV